MLPREVYLPGDRGGFKVSALSRGTLLMSEGGEWGEGGGNVPFVVENAIRHK